MEMKLINIHGRANICKCKSWLYHWEKFSREAATFCVVETCREVATVGVLVQKDSLFSSGWYVIPVCDKHNKVAPKMEIRNSTCLVSANVSQTCAETKYGFFGAPYWS
jgi:hypothetical protein